MQEFYTPIHTKRQFKKAIKLLSKNGYTETGTKGSLMTWAANFSDPNLVIHSADHNSSIFTASRPEIFKKQNRQLVHYKHLKDFLKG